MNEMMSPSRSRADEFSHEAAIRLGKAVQRANGPLGRLNRRVYRIGAGLQGWGTGRCYGYKVNGGICECCPF